MKYKSIPDLFWSQVEKYGDRTALRRKVGTKWEPVTWKQWGEKVEAAASGLLALGLKRGDHVSILSNNRVEWVVADLGIICSGGATVGVYASNLPSEVAYVAGHAESPFIFVENKEQLRKVLDVRSQLSDLKKIIAFDMPTGFEDRDVLSLDELLSLGREHLADNRSTIKDVRENTDAEDVALIVYTSGTTGPPKGAMLSHKNIIWTAGTSVDELTITEKDESLSFLPLAHLLEHFLFFGSVMLGGVINYAESIDKIAQNMLEVRPSVVVGVPRVYEKIYSRLQNMAAQKGKLGAAIFKTAKNAAIEYARKRSRGKPIGLGLKIRHGISDRLVYSKLRESTGGRIRFFGSGGAPLSAEIAEFFYGAGLPIVESWGMTETTAPSTLTRPNEIRPGTVGRPLPGVDVKIEADGEILVRGPNVFKGYFKNPAATAEALEGGWMHTGDVGEFDSEGMLKITDRKKDLIITAGGKNIAPQNIENLMKTNPLFSQVVVIGDRQPYCVALLTLNEEEVRRFASEKRLTEKNYAELVKTKPINDLAAQAVAEKNSHLARYEQIKKFRIIPYDFSQATGELTPTMKVKRKVVNQKFADIIQEMYEGPE